VKMEKRTYILVFSQEITTSKYLSDVEIDIVRF